MLSVKILDPRLHEWGPPQYHSAEAAGIDLRACIAEPLALQPQGNAVLIPSGIAIAMPNSEMFAILASRSGMGHKGLIVSQGIGTIDSDYHAEVFISVWAREPDADIVIQPGDRIAQLVFVPLIRPRIAIVDDLPRTTERGGFGSTGR